MTWRIQDKIVNQHIQDVSTTKHFSFGTIVQAYDPDYGVGEFIYLKGVTSGAQYAWVTYNLDDGSTTLLAANAIGPVGVMMAALDATTDFGWVCISGKVIGKCLTSFADNGQVWITATGGSVDDASVAGDLVNNAKGASTTTAGTNQADFEISRPWVDNISSAS
jgi:hypothetical protein